MASHQGIRPSLYRTAGDLRNLHLWRLFRCGRRRSAARDVIARRRRDTGACQRRQERHPRRSERVAAVLFVVSGTGEWSAVIPLGLGCLVGSRLGPIVVRHAPTRTDEGCAIGAAGLALAIKLAIDAYRNPREKTQTSPNTPKNGCFWSARQGKLAQIEWIVALGNSGAHVDQILRRRVKSLARLPAGLTHQIARPGALDHDAQLEARHRDIPIEP